MAKKTNKSEPFYHRLRFLDQFGSPAVFTIDGNDSFGTVIGVLWSLLFLVLLLLSFFYYGKIYHLHEDPDVQTSLITDGSVADLELSKYNFFVSFQFREDGRPIESKEYEKEWFRIQASAVTETRDTDNTSSTPTVVRTPIDIKDCEDTSSLDQK